LASVHLHRKQGFAVVGMLPDMNGFGMPDIIMAKRITAR
jgi:L-amino acid N-acyltransferase YncA